MFVLEVLARVTLGLLVVLAGVFSSIYGFLFATELVHLSVSPETVGSLIGSLLMLLPGVWGFRKLAARSRARSK